MRAPLGGQADHVVRGDLRLCHRVAPVLERHELVVVEGVGEARHVAGDEDVVDGDGVDGEGAAAGVAGHPERPHSEPAARQPLGVADRPQAHHRHVGVDHVAVREVRAAQAPLLDRPPVP